MPCLDAAIALPVALSGLLGCFVLTHGPRVSCLVGRRDGPYALAVGVKVV